MEPIIDDILKDLQKTKKKIKSGVKGKQSERDLVKILNKRFENLLSRHEEWGKFSRSVGSGNRWSQNVDLPKHAKDTFSGDICVPQNFLWVIESKKGYNDDIDLCTLFGGTCSLLEGFFKQVEDDSGRCNRKPMLIWKKDYKPRLAFIKNSVKLNGNFSCFMTYKGWSCVPFDELLNLEDLFFFSQV